VIQQQFAAVGMADRVRDIGIAVERYYRSFFPGGPNVAVPVPAVVIGRTANAPFTHNFLRNGNARVDLNILDGMWMQAVYQYAHEFLHVVAFYGTNRIPQPHNLFHSVDYPHQWLEECFAEMSSLLLLEEIVAVWSQAETAGAITTTIFQTTKLPAAAKSYLKERRAQVCRDLQIESLDSVDFLEWFVQAEQHLRQDATTHGIPRSRTTVVARLLLSVVKQHRNCWGEAILFLRDTNVPPIQQTLVQHLISWQQRAPVGCHDFILAVRAVFGIPPPPPPAPLNALPPVPLNAPP
jgi:hypothetical protein